MSENKIYRGALCASEKEKNYEVSFNFCWHIKQKYRK